MADDTSTVLLLAAGGVLYLLLRPSAATPAATGTGTSSSGALPAQGLQPGVVTVGAGGTPAAATPGVALPAVTWIDPFAPGTVGIPVGTSPATPVVVGPGAVSTVPVVPGTTIPLATGAVVVGAASAALTDTQLAKVVTGLTLKVAQAGGTLIQMTGLADIGTVLQVIGTVGLVVDMAFTILGNASDAQKAFDTAMDAVMIAALWIPVYGWIVAIVVGIVKLIVDMFGFGGGLTHAQREALERQAYGEALAPMLADLGHAYSPREMIRVLIAWGTGYCGGVHAIAMATQLRDGAGGMVPIEGQPCYQWADQAGTRYHGLVLPAAGLGVDDLARLLVQYGTTDLVAEAQVGITESMKTIFNQAVTERIQRKIPTWQSILAQGGTLDDLDTVADEIRLTPDLHALANFYGFDTWQAMLTPMLQPAWTPYYAAHAADGTLSGFARANGYHDLRAWRTALFAPLWPAWQRWSQVLDGCAAVVDRITRPWGVLELARELAPAYVDPNVTGAGGGP